MTLIEDNIQSNIVICKVNSSSNMARGSLLLAWQVANKHCLVIGGGDVALSRVEHMIRAGAKITVVTGSGHIHPKIIELSEQGSIYSLIKRDFKSEDLKMYEKSQVKIEEVFDLLNAQHYEEINDAVQNQIFAVVCCCIDDYDLSTKIYYQCKLLRLPVNIADKPPMCDFYFGSMYNRDNLQIMISTNGMSPRLLKLIKDNISRQFNDIDLNKAVENLGHLRARLREKVVTQDDLLSIDARMAWIKLVTDYFTIRQWSEMDLGTDIADRMLSYYPELPPNDYENYVS